MNFKVFPKWAVLWAMVWVNPYGDVIKGMVTDISTNLPLNEVFLELNVVGGGGGEVTLSTTSAASGLFEFPELDGGLYNLSVYKNGYLVAQKPLFLEAGDKIQNLDIALIPVGGGVGEFQIAGRVESLDSQVALPNARVILFLLSPPGQLRHISNAIDTAVSDSQGQFNFPNLAGGSYSLQVEANGYKLLNRNVFLQEIDSVWEVLLLEIFTPPSGGIAGVIFNKETDLPVGPDVGVSLLRTFHMDGEFEIEAQTTTNELGEFQFTDLEPSGSGGHGIFTIYALVVGGDTTNFVNVEESQVTRVEIEVGPQDAAFLEGLSEAENPPLIQLLDHTLVLSDKNESVRLQIYNLRGQLLFSGLMQGENYELDLAGLPGQSCLFLRAESERTPMSVELMVKLR